MNMYALRIKTFTVGQCEKCFNHVTADLGGAGPAGHAKMIAATGNLNIQASFDLSKVFVELAAEVGQTFVIGGLEYDVP